MSDSDVDSDEAREEIMPLRPSDYRHQRQQSQFSQEDDEQQILPLSSKPPGRATRFLSISDPSLQLPSESLFKLRRLHSQTTNDRNSFISGEITDELLDKIPFKIEIIPERQDDLDIDESQLKKRHQKNLITTNKESIQIPSVISSGLSEERRLQIIEEILKDLNGKNILDEIRRTNAIPFRLPTNTQIQKNIAERIRDLTGSEIIMFNDHIYMKNLCKRLDEKHKEELEKNFQRIGSTEKRRELFENIFHSN